MDKKRFLIAIKTFLTYYEGPEPHLYEATILEYTNDLEKRIRELEEQNKLLRDNPNFEKVQ